jgi:hypothetical protein
MRFPRMLIAAVLLVSARQMSAQTIRYEQTARPAIRPEAVRVFYHPEAPPSLDGCARVAQVTGRSGRAGQAQRRIVAAAAHVGANVLVVQEPQTRAETWTAGGVQGTENVVILTGTAYACPAT